MPVTLSNVAHQDLDPNSPFANPATCPTHIEVDGYGCVPISIMKKSFWSDAYTPVRPNVHERVLYTRPVHAADMVHAPSEPKAAKIVGLTLLAALSGAAIAVSVTMTTPVYGVLLGIAGALGLIISLACLLETISPARVTDRTPNRAPHTFAELRQQQA